VVSVPPATSIPLARIFRFRARVADQPQRPTAHGRPSGRRQLAPQHGERVNQPGNQRAARHVGIDKRAIDLARRLMASVTACLVMALNTHALDLLIL
jgi:hypothetical protein